MWVLGRLGTLVEALRAESRGGAGGVEAGETFQEVLVLTRRNNAFAWGTGWGRVLFLVFGES